MDFYQTSLSQLHDDLVNKKISATELTKETFDHIKGNEDQVKAFISLNEDQALKRAAEIDAKGISADQLTAGVPLAVKDNIKGNEDQVKAFISLNEDQALKRAAEIDAKGISADQLTAGVPLAVKDNILTKGLTTTAASKMLENFNPVYDATVVEKLNAADYINVGKTNLDEFAMGSSTENSAFFTTHNPWDLTRVPGGSSGGSAAADYINVGKTNLDEFAMGSSTENSAFFTTHNPWDLTRVPGGSSGGSAAAVAAGDVLGALGTDTGGSIRMPASFNGVVGMKPTYGRVSRWGIIAFGSSFDQVGWLTQNVKDNALLTALISGNDERDMTSSLKEVPDWAAQLNENTNVKGLRIAVPKEYFDGLDEDVQEVIKAALDHLESLGPDWAAQLNENTNVKGLRIAVPKEYFDGLDEDVQEVIKAALDHLESLGAIVDEVSLPHTKYGVPAYYILASSEASSNLQRYDGIRYGFRAADVKNLEDVYVRSRSEGFGEEVKRRIMLGTKNLEDVYVRSRSEGFGEEVKRRIMLGTFSLSAGFYDAYFNKAAKVRRLIAQDFEDVFKDHDVIVGATGASTAFKIGAEIDDPQTMYMNDVLTVPVNMAGLPAMSIPAGFSAKNGMPVGLQIIGKAFDEQTVYNTGYVFEQTTDFHKKTPKLGGQN